MASSETLKFDAHAFFEAVGVPRRTQVYQRTEVIVSQGDPCDRVGYLQQGAVKLSVTSKSGREAVVAMLGPGAFFGEGCLTGLAAYPAAAIATTTSTVVIVPKDEMLRVLHTHHAMSDRFIAHLLARNIRAEEDLLDQMFNSCEKRLARTLVLLARQGTHVGMGPAEPDRQLQAISQTTLAEMVGTTRSRVNFFLQKFERQGFIDAEHGLRINPSLLTMLDD